MNDGLPERFVLNDFQLDRLQISYMRLTTRELLKETRLAWRRSGYPKPRGWKAPTLPLVRRRLDAIAPIFLELLQTAKREDRLLNALRRNRY
jgi:hypothetical protein